MLPGPQAPMVEGQGGAVDVFVSIEPDLSISQVMRAGITVLVTACRFFTGILSIGFNDGLHDRATTITGASARMRVSLFATRLSSRG